MRLLSTVFNTTDVAKLSAFWAELLDLEEARSVGEHFTWLTPIGETGITLAFQKVDAPTGGRRRLYFDFEVDDLSATQGRIIELGGAHLEEHAVGDFSWWVMADLDGNEFCITEGH